MKLAEDWMIDLEKNLYNGEKCPRIMRENMKEGFRAGMLASADIAERMYFTHTPDDGVISGAGVAVEIRKRANDI